MRTFHRLVLVLGLLVVGVGAVEARPASAGGGGCHRDRQFGPTEATGTRVDLVDFCMSTSVLRVEAGATVTFTNRDPAAHNVIGSGMFVDELGPDESTAFRFDDTGTFAYSCTLHPGMVGAIVVGDGRRTAPATLPILPVEVQPAGADSALTPTTLAAVPVGVTSPSGGDDLPLVPMLVALAVAASIAYAAGRRRRAAGAAFEVTTS